MEHELRNPLIAGNWKMNTTVDEALSLVDEMLRPLDSLTGLEVLVCPPFVSLAVIAEKLKNTGVKLGAQNMNSNEKGAFTGEISPLMLKPICSYVIVGHSERRQYFGETDQMVNKKLAAAQMNQLIPVLCVGERLDENESSRTEEVIRRQVTEGLRGNRKDSSLVIAYEPVWAIGTGKAATPAIATNTVEIIRDAVSRLWGSQHASEIRVLYGGSVTASNISEFVHEPSIDGALVGGASLKATEFISICRQTADIKQLQS
jgi:triosephosphate isomerase